MPEIPQLKDNYVIVTGASGFIGGAIVRRLAIKGVSVCGLVRNEVAATSLLEDSQGSKYIRTAICDLESECDLRHLFKGASVIYHAAGLVSSPASSRRYYRTNVTGTKIVCESALAVGVPRLVYISTCDVFGLPSKFEEMSECSRYKEWGEKYPDTKILATRLVKDFRKKGLNSVIVYPGWVYGPGDNQFLPSLIAQLRTGILPLWRRPIVELNLIHIDDLVEGILRAGSFVEAKNEDFILLDTNRVSLKKICDLIAVKMSLRYKTINVNRSFMTGIAYFSKLIAKTGFTAHPALTTEIVKSFGHQFKFSTSNASKILEWKPNIEFSEGLREALEWESDRNKKQK